MNKRKKNPVMLSQLGVRFRLKDKKKSIAAKYDIWLHLRSARGSQRMHYTNHSLRVKT